MDPPFTQDSLKFISFIYHDFLAAFDVNMSRGLLQWLFIHISGNWKTTHSPVERKKINIFRETLCRKMFKKRCACNSTTHRVYRNSKGNTDLCINCMELKTVMIGTRKMAVFKIHSWVKRYNFSSSTQPVHRKLGSIVYTRNCDRQQR
jgi:hypothetical protein